MEDYINTLNILGTKKSPKTSPPNTSPTSKKYISPGKMARDMVHRKMEPRRQLEQETSISLMDQEIESFLREVQSDTLSRIMRTVDSREVNGRHIDANKFHTSKRRKIRKRLMVQYEIVQCEDESEPNNLYVAYKCATRYTLFKLYGRKDGNFHVDTAWKEWYMLPHDVIDKRSGKHFQTKNYSKIHSKKEYLTWCVFSKKDTIEALLNVCDDGWKVFRKKLANKILG